jgi:DNA-binding transcriptional LysR family regulator
MNLSQPAVSAALSRLRTYFDDPLLVPIGKRFVLSPTGEALLPLARRWLGDADAMILASRRFDPKTSKRTFRIIASDYTTTVVLTNVAGEIQRAAPGVRLDIRPPFEGSAESIDAGTADLLIGPASFVLPQHPHELLFQERHVVVGWANNPALAEPMSEALFLQAGHVVASFGPRGEASFGDQALQKLGVERRIEVTTSSFLAIPCFLLHTQRLAIMHERLARFFGSFFPLRLVDPPFSIPVLDVVMQHHSARNHDPGLCWLRGLIRQLGGSRGP